MAHLEANKRMRACRKASVPLTPEELAVCGNLVFSPESAADLYVSCDFRGEPIGPNNVLHWGQWKLALSELHFLTQCAPSGEGLVVYAGAAEGSHIPWLMQLLPRLRWLLVDPANFAPALHAAAEARIWSVEARARGGEIAASGAALPARTEVPEGPAPVQRVATVAASTEPLAAVARRMLEAGEGPRLALANTFFTDAAAGAIGGLPRGRPLLFVSDIRRQVEEALVLEDMDMQRGWCLALRPDWASLKFRLPYAYETVLRGAEVPRATGQTLPDILAALRDGPAAPVRSGRVEFMRSGKLLMRREIYDGLRARGLVREDLTVLPYRYLSGKACIQAFSRLHSAEGRLITDCKGEALYDFALWEAQCYHHNEWSRAWGRAPVPPEPDRSCDGMDGCADCYISRGILERWLASPLGARGPWRTVRALGAALVATINAGRPERAWRTLWHCPDTSRRGVAGRPRGGCAPEKTRPEHC